MQVQNALSDWVSIVFDKAAPSVKSWVSLMDLNLNRKQHLPYSCPFPPVKKKVIKLTWLLSKPLQYSHDSHVNIAPLCLFRSGVHNLSTPFWNVENDAGLYTLHIHPMVIHEANPLGYRILVRWLVLCAKLGRSVITRAPLCDWAENQKDWSSEPDWIIAIVQMLQVSRGPICIAAKTTTTTKMKTYAA